MKKVKVVVPEETLEMARKVLTRSKNDGERLWALSELGLAVLRTSEGAPSGRKLKPEIANDIKNAFQIWEGPLKGGMIPEHALDMCAKHAIGLLELDSSLTDDWYEDET